MAVKNIRILTAHLGSKGGNNLTSVKLEVAQEMLLNLVKVMPTERVALHACWRRILGETVISDMDFPPFDRSPLDGYHPAVRHQRAGAVGLGQDHLHQNVEDAVGGVGACLFLFQRLGERLCERPADRVHRRDQQGHAG